MSVSQNEVGICLGYCIYVMLCVLKLPLKLYACGARPLFTPASGAIALFVSLPATIRLINAPAHEERRTDTKARG